MGRRAVCVVALALAAAGAGCGGDKDQPASAPTTSTSTAPPPSSPQTGQANGSAPAPPGLSPRKKRQLDRKARQVVKSPTAALCEGVQGQVKAHVRTPAEADRVCAQLRRVPKARPGDTAAMERQTRELLRIIMESNRRQLGGQAPRR